MTNSETPPPIGRTILNANEGVANIIEKEVIRRDMAKVTNKIFNLLKKHYGPYSSFAGVDPNRPLEDTVFTKDGANIIKSVEYASPLEDWVRKTVAYIGSRMERSAGDGTTSAMMFACGMLKHMTATLGAIQPVSYYELSTAYKRFIDSVKYEMRDYIITAKRDDVYEPERVKELVYMQTMTSSHGNVELAEAISTMFYRLPPGMWPKITFQRKRYESSKDIEVVESKHQYTVTECEIMSKTVYNKETGRYLEYPDATLIVINGTVMLDSPAFGDIIEKKIEAATKENPVVIFCNNNFDNATFGKLMKYTTDGKALAVFTTEMDHPRINDFTILQAVTGANVMEYSGGEFADRPLVVEHVYVKHENRILELDNLYKDDREASPVVRERPYYSDASRPYYREFCDTISKFIDVRAENVETPSEQRELNYMQRMYNKLVYDKQLTLVIGGKTFDNLAMFDVVDDCIRASIKSLENGAVVSNSKTLYQAAKATLNVANHDLEVLNATAAKTTTNRQDIKKRRLVAWFAINTIRTLEEFPSVVLEQIYPRGVSTVPGRVPRNRWWNTFFAWGSDTAIGDVCREFGMTDLGLRMCSVPKYEDMEKLMSWSEEEEKEFTEWWFDNSVNILNYDNTKTWNDQSIDTAMSFKRIRRREYKNTGKDAMIIQPANADIDMLERFGEIAIKFVLTDRVIVSGSAYVNDKKDTKK